MALFKIKGSTLTIIIIGAMLLVFAVGLPQAAFDYQDNSVSLHASNTYPLGCEWDSTNSKWVVSDANQGYFYTYDSDFSGASEKTNSYGDAYMGMTVGNGFMYAVTIGDVVKEFGLTNFSRTGGSWSIGAQSSSTDALGWDGTNFYMLSTQNDEVYQYDTSWTYTSTKWSIPDHTWSDMYWDGNYWYLTDKGTDNVSQYDSDWEFIDSWEVSETLNAEAVCGQGTAIWVLCDTFNAAKEYEHPPAPEPPAEEGGSAADPCDGIKTNGEYDEFDSSGNYCEDAVDCRFDGAYNYPICTTNNQVDQYTPIDQGDLNTNSGNDNRQPLDFNQQFTNFLYEIQQLIKNILGAFGV